MTFHYTVTTENSVEEAIEQVKESLQEIQFSVLWETNITNNLHDKGLTEITSNYHVLEVCNAKEAERVLLQNEEAVYFLPCKITVFEKEGKTHIGLPRPTVLMQPLNDSQLQKYLETIEERLIEAVNRSK